MNVKPITCECFDDAIMSETTGAGLSSLSELYLSRTIMRGSGCLRILIATILLSYSSLACAFASSEGVAPSMAIEMLMDPTRELTVDDMRSGAAPAGFVPVHGGGINLGYVRDAIWLRLTITSAETTDMMLALTPNIVDLVDVYVIDPDEKPDMVAIHKLGDHRPISYRLSGLDDVVRINLEADVPMTVYVRAQAINTVMGLQLALYSPADHTYRATVSGLVYGGWFGGMAILLIIQLVFYFYDRKPYFLLLAFSTFFAMLVYFGSLGLSRLFLFPSGGSGNDIFTAGVSWFGISASALATRSILDLPRRSWVDRIFIAGAVFGVAGVGFALIGQNMVFAPLAQTTILVLATIAVVQAFRTINAADTSSHFRAAAFACLWIGLFLTLAQRAGLAPVPDWLAHGYAAGSILYTVLLTGTLAYRLRLAETMNAVMREQALVSAQEAERRATDLVEERTRELAAAKKVAVDALDAELASQQRQVRFMEVIRHQYRTPLAAIQTLVSSIDLSLPRDDTANRQRVVRVKRGIGRLVEVLEVNLSRSRLQGPAFQPELTPHAPDSLAREAVSRAEDLLNVEIALSVSTDAQDVDVLADGEMFTIAIINLLENAVKFSQPANREPVSLQVDLDGGSAVFRVRDAGIGILPAELDRIFEASFRGSNAAQITGTGTGLSLVSRIVAAHGGSIEVTSEVGSGTTVTIRLPLSDSESEAETPAFGERESGAPPEMGAAASACQHGR